ncbi:NUDIX hydrolase [Balneola sp. MJW-20]|uniref:NUDIX hydrolase n=1 Tax=Gracilimonas aurantiaca TaxID=3234185 RepID=UPI003467A25F
MTANKAKPITAAGGILYRYSESGTTEVLLIFRNGVWDLPKGKLDEGESIAQCAVREVSEEISCPLPAIVSVLTETYHEYNEKGMLWGKTTYWYSMILPVAADLKPQTKEGITSLEWVETEEAIARVGYENLKTVLKAFKKSVQ